MDRETIENDLIEGRSSRRRLLGTLGVGALTIGAPSLVFGGAPKANNRRDVDILNFALHLEYLDSEYYTYATTGSGIEALGIETDGMGRRGDTIGGARVRFDDPELERIANEIAADERAQIQTIRAAIRSLGGTPIAKPALDLTAARGMGIDPTTPEGFLLATRAFEDTAVSAYGGTAAFLTNPVVIQSSARILSVEAYHSGNVRLQLERRNVTVPPLDRLDLPPQGSDANADYFPADERGLAPIRTVEQVLRIVLMAPTGPLPMRGGFFPAGPNSDVRPLLRLRPPVLR